MALWWHSARLSQLVSSPGAAGGDRCQKQFRVKSATGEVGGDGFSRLLRGGAGIKKDDDRWTGSTQGRSENPRFAIQFTQAR